MKDTMSSLLEERKYKMACIIAVIGVLLITIAIFVFFGRRNAKEKELSAKNVVAVVGYEEAYQLLCDLGTTSYETQTLSEFSETIENYFKDKKCTFKDAMDSVLSEIKEEDAAYDFVTETLMASYTEMDNDCKVPYVTCAVTAKYIDYSGTEGTLKLTAKVEYTVLNRNQMTVQERDGEIATYTTKIKQYINQMLINHMSETDIKDEVEAQMEAWSGSFSDDKIKFKASVNELELK
ncbi:MAG: hypothetical protein Q4F05_06880 [bacterium]|nr:hypothetical protein [bacterium]